MNPIETHERGTYTIEIHYDDCPESPRDQYCLGTMLYVSDRYVLGDERVTVKEIDEISRRGDVVWVPVYAYIHSGVRLQTTSFAGMLPQGHYEFDSGQCGIIYVTCEDIRREYHRKRITPRLREIVKTILAKEVRDMDNYLNGNVYGFIVRDLDGEEISSCWGFLGDIDYCRQEAGVATDYAKKEAVS
jgi:hypothetical protein